MRASPVAAIVRGWVRLYTRGLPGPLRDARRNEIEDDLWCEREEAAALGRSGRALDRDLMLRLLLGMPADISWRLTDRQAASATVERVSSVGTRIVGASAIVAVTSALFLAVLMSAVPALGTADDTTVPVEVVVGTIVLGGLALLVAALGLAVVYQDRIGNLGGAGAAVVAIGAITTIGSGFAAPIVVGSAMLMWDLARIGAVSRLVPIVHVATAFFFVTWRVLGGIGIDQGDLGRGVSTGAFDLYLVTWAAIGLSLIRGVPKVQAPSD